MNLLTHICQSAKVNRVAYDAEAKKLYVEFKPKMSVYVYDVDGDHHFDYISTVKQAYADFLADHEAGEIFGTPEGVTPGSEGSYIVNVIVGKDRKNPPFPFRRLDPEEAGQVFPFVEAA